jgi:hypothetical protein
MTTLALVLLLAAPPGLLPRKPAAPPGATKGPVLTPDPIPDQPPVPPVIVDGDAPPELQSAEDERPAPRAQQAEDPDPEPSVARAGPTGQWVFTHQYGWLWMAHDDAYWYAPPSGRGHPHAYVYVPNKGWDWVDAPWVWGIGPRPSFGPSGPWRFGWYRAGYWRTPWRWRYWPGPFRG